MRRCLLLVFAGACIHSTTMPITWPALDANLLADAAATYSFRLGLPVPVAVTPDGAVLFRRTPPRSFVADLYELDTRSGAVKTLVTTAQLLGSGGEQLSEAEKARRERTRTATKGVVEVDVSADGRTVLVPLGGELHLIDRATGVRRAIDPKGEADDPHLSPDGTQIAFVRDGDLWVVAATGAPRRLTHHPEGITYGTAEFVAQEELDRRRGFWWSPDGKDLLFQRTDARQVQTVYVADARHPTVPPVPFKYPRAGTPNAIVDLGIIPVAGGAPSWLSWDLAAYPYLGRVAWPAKGPLSIVVLSRPQTDLAVIDFGDHPKGAGKVLLTEHDAAWLNLGGSGAGQPPPIGTTLGAPMWLPDGSGFLWATESHGAWTVELRKPDGTLVRPLTTPEFGLRELVGIDGNFAITIASSEPTHADVWLVPIDGSAAPSRLTDGSGWSTAEAAHGVTIVFTDDARGRTVTANGHVLPSVAERPHRQPTTRLETVSVGGRTQYVAITRPRAFDPAKRYPVLLKVYGAPHAQMVTAAPDAYVMDQWYADAGFIVVRTDGRGTPARGRAWERAIAGDLATIPLADQVAALQAMGKAHPELDLARVGIFGWSFGGYLTTIALELRPDVFACGVAGAPVTDWALYDTAYTERYMRTPEANPAGYATASALAHAAKLVRPLLLIHGITDDNVHLANSIALIEDLFDAGKRAEVVLLSGTHMVPDPKLALAREQVQIDFFREHLGPPP